ncbi:hypothetical protein M407DRAFT_156709 [Tulasnella calospora MUT 4182]|uniref:Cystathionine gamma-synthase n=1 Tax=Tulasnella calospora MUT 4182 TaxID=1051891 RepID=A0A0C3QR59_9AGAM|nr:hypothetical protein M407DRAFT_156709 [Tulasnella calospora MUT 4182]
MSPPEIADLGLGSLLLHADDTPNEQSISPAISLSTTFRQQEGFDLETQWDPADPKRHVYSRYTTPISIRLEKVLGTILKGDAITYASGLQAANAAITHYNPRRVAITKGYMGVHHILDIHKRSAPNLTVIDLDEDYQEGDLAWVETPVNPTGEARNLKHYADKIHAVGGKLVVDATFGPPPLQDPFEFGADCVFHSGTKYLGGHSDLLAGVLVVKESDVWKQLFEDRVNLGGVMGSMESWLLLRSLRTLHLRVPRQSQTAQQLVNWLDTVSRVPKGEEFEGIPGGTLTKVHHASLQPVDRGGPGLGPNGFDVSKQMPGGYSASFSIILGDANQAKSLPFRTRLFAPATSLGGVESLLEQRVMADPKEDPRLVRLSVGLEEVEDLKADLRQALKAVASS